MATSIPCRRAIDFLLDLLAQSRLGQQPLGVEAVDDFDTRANGP